MGEYDVVILSARDSAGLERWLRRGNYKIPAGSEPLLRPYVQAGSKFFVAKVNAKKVKFKNGQAMLSPLRFHYDSETFSLPVRLGLLNSAGTQDLIVHILAHSRYEAANYPNVAIPTNLEVTDAVRNDFGSFYAALFDRTVARQPGAVTTEYAWDFNTKCDPCVDSTFGPLEVLALGADVLESTQVAPPTSIPAGPQKVPSPSPAPPPLPVFNLGSFVLTRLHVRYGKDGLGNDLVFRTAPPMAGGQEFLGDNDQIEPGASEFGSNSFQARYAIRYAWTGPMGCTSPVRGIWGEPPRGVTRETAKAAQQLAFAKRGGFDLATMIARDHDETKIDNGLLPKWTATDASAPAPEPSTDKPPPPVDTTRPAPSASSAARPPPAPPAGGCAGCRVGEPNRPAVPAGAGIVAAMGIAMTRMLRRKKTR